MSVSPYSTTALGLGLDAGGTQTRWALAQVDGHVLAEGQVAGLSGLQLASSAGRVSLAQISQVLASAVLARGRPRGIYAGITGVGESDGPAAAQLRELLSQALGLAPAAIFVGSDMDIAYRSAFAPGEGYLLYAGTGAIAAFIDEQGRMQRAGGRGPLLGDEGGGFWIAREALAVAAAAEQDGDAQARALLYRAGQELARLALALIRRYGARPVVAAGRALQLHPLLGEGLRAGLPGDTSLTITHLQPHLTAAQLAARS